MFLSSAIAVECLPLGMVAILLNTSVIFIPLLSWAMGKEQMSLWKLFYILSLIVGVILVVQPEWIFNVKTKINRFFPPLIIELLKPY